MKTRRNFFKNNKIKILSFACILFLVVCFLNFVNFSKDDAKIHQNLVDQKIALYSDSRITENAIKTNIKFKNLAFDKREEKSLWQNQLASALRSAKSFLSLPQDNEGTEREYGSWVWTPTPNLTPEYTENLLSDSEKNGVNVVYLSLDSYLDIFVMEKGEVREEKKKLFENRLTDFIRIANSHGIKVDAEAGWRNWAEPGNEYKAFAILNFVKNFNETSKYKFRGFQYDIEPYLLPEFQTKPEQVLQNFVGLVDKTANFLTDSSLYFSVVIPDFYDEKDELTPKFSYNGNKTYTFEHLLEILNTRNNSSIIIMSYRSFADGYDGSIEISQNEMQTAKDGGYRTKIIIAQETGDVPPPYITFHGTSKKYLNKQVEKINRTFGDHPNFGGIAFHYLNSLLALK